MIKKYRIIPAEDFQYRVQYKTGLFWWTVTYSTLFDDFPKTFASKEVAKQWIDEDIERESLLTKHFSQPPEEYP